MALEYLLTFARPARPAALLLFETLAKYRRAVGKMLRALRVKSVHLSVMRLLDRRFELNHRLRLREEG